MMKKVTPEGLVGVKKGASSYLAFRSYTLFPAF
jgi:hypothetical protein